MDSNSLYKEREQNLLDAASFRKVKKFLLEWNCLLAASYAEVTYSD